MDTSNSLHWGHLPIELKELVLTHLINSIVETILQASLFTFMQKRQSPAEDYDITSNTRPRRDSLEHVKRPLHHFWETFADEALVPLERARERLAIDINATNQVLRTLMACLEIEWTGSHISKAW